MHVRSFQPSRHKTRIELVILWMALATLCVCGCPQDPGTSPLTEDPGPNQQVSQYALSVSAVPAEAGEVAVEPDQGNYAGGDAVTLQAISNSGWLFDHWIGDVEDSSSTSTTLIVRENITVVAVFVQEVTYTLDASAVPGIAGKITVTPDAERYAPGTQVQLDAEPSTGWNFVQWIGDVPNSALASTTITMDSDRVIVAVFEEQDTAQGPSNDIVGSWDVFAGSTHRGVHTFQSNGVVVPGDGYAPVTYSFDGVTVRYEYGTPTWHIPVSLSFVSPDVLEGTWGYYNNQGDINWYTECQAYRQE